MTTKINIKYESLWYEFKDNTDINLYIVILNSELDSWLYYINNLQARIIEHYDNFKKVYEYEISENLKYGGFCVLKFKKLSESQITDYHNKKHETTIYYGYDELIIETQKSLLVKKEV